MLLSYSRGRRSAYTALGGLMLDAKRRYAFSPHNGHPPCLNVGMSLSNAVRPLCQRRDVFWWLKGLCTKMSVVLALCGLSVAISQQTHRAKRGGMFGWIDRCSHASA
jgi:hypothetical protein